jgi:uncharacterized alpha-E superfamily protein
VAPDAARRRGALFRKTKEVSTAGIVEFYVNDIANPGSIRSSIHWARENARALRPFIPLEMWVQLTRLIRPSFACDSMGSDEPIGLA